MSCHMNGKPMSEGRSNYATMPATTSCDRRRPADTKPLTRAQIAKYCTFPPRVKINTRRPKLITDEHVKAARQVLASGGSYKEAATAAKCSLASVYRIVGDEKGGAA